jgi:hypothetical protein
MWEQAMLQNIQEHRSHTQRRIASILQLMPRNVFDDAATKVMGEAFDAACGALHATGQPEKARRYAVVWRGASRACEKRPLHRITPNVTPAMLQGSRSL